MTPPLAAASRVSPAKVATPFWAWTVLGKPGSPGSEIVTAPLKLGSTFWNASSAETTRVNGWPAVTGLGGGVDTTSCVAVAELTLMGLVGGEDRLPLLALSEIGPLVVETRSLN